MFIAIIHITFNFCTFLRIHQNKENTNARPILFFVILVKLITLKGILFLFLPLTCKQKIAQIYTTDINK